MKYIEGWAQGIGKAMRGCESNGNPEPEFPYIGGGLLVTLIPRPSRAKTPMKTSDLPLDGIDEAIIALMASSPSVSQKDIASSVGLSLSGVKRRIERLKDAGIVSRGRGGKRCDPG